MQEHVISALAKEVRNQQANYGGNKSKAREKLIELASKEIELEQLKKDKKENLPEIERMKKEMMKLKGLQ